MKDFFPDGGVGKKTFSLALWSNGTRLIRVISALFSFFMGSTHKSITIERSISGTRLYYECFIVSTVLCITEELIGEFISICPKI